MTRIAVALLAILLLAPVARPADPTPEIDRFIRNYFATWTDANFAGYAACFHPRARVTFVSENAQVATLPAADFVAEQEELQTRARYREIPLSISVKALRDRAALVEAEWELTYGDGTKKTGIDWFHLVRERADAPWQILYLSFWADPTLGQGAPPAARP